MCLCFYLYSGPTKEPGAARQHPKGRNQEQAIGIVNCVNPWIRLIVPSAPQWRWICISISFFSPHLPHSVCVCCCVRHWHPAPYPVHAVATGKVQRSVTSSSRERSCHVAAIFAVWNILSEYFFHPIHLLLFFYALIYYAFMLLLYVWRPLPSPVALHSNHINSPAPRSGVNFIPQHPVVDCRWNWMNTTVLFVAVFVFWISLVRNNAPYQRFWKWLIDFYFAKISASPKYGFMLRDAGTATSWQALNCLYWTINEHFGVLECELNVWE